ncbi:hypothetical protein GCM10011367_14230 [Marinicauda pacifica]|jgi:hypothetical protein|uniref:Uncharacterized protein n=1 Tax=Marinicauda pacifica TaxID=1133559 RepID=A0A4V3RZ45_9PROT|nr:hypothetical protein [Marinicauda pacifica]TGY92849.1 hypothetical protein E5162_07190 [Marinicauda pacifica]GGE40829.1 hypothetical protein GCM10011367_14230 [Marinicauda pacifica]
MFGGRKAEERRREEIRMADQAADHALAAMGAGDLDRARDELSAAPKKLDFADIGWKVEAVSALLELATNKRKAAIKRLTEFAARLDETSLSKDDKGYLRLFALYRAIEASKTNKAPAELRMHTEDFRFDHTLVSGALKSRFPLKKTEPSEPAPPPIAAPPASNDDGKGPF